MDNIKNILKNYHSAKVYKCEFLIFVSLQIRDGHSQRQTGILCVRVKFVYATHPLHIHTKRSMAANWRITDHILKTTGETTKFLMTRLYRIIDLIRKDITCTPIR